MRIDGHHHLWDLQEVEYPWLMAKGVPRFFGNPEPIQRNYLIDEFRRDAAGFSGSVHIQVGAANAWDEAQWVQKIADQNPDWKLVQVVHCDLTGQDCVKTLERFKSLNSVRGVRQIVGRAPEEDAVTGTNDLLDNPRFVEGLRLASEMEFSFDLQLIPELMEKTAIVLKQAPDLSVALCHAGSPHDRTSTGLEKWRAALKSLSALPNVTCKLSGLGMFDHGWSVTTIAPIVETCLEQFGIQRCMFGSNFPVDKLYSDYEKLIRAYEVLVPKQHHDAIFGANASDFYKINI